MKLLTEATNVHKAFGGVPSRYLKWCDLPLQVDALRAVAWWGGGHAALTPTLPRIGTLDIDTCVAKYR